MTGAVHHGAVPHQGPVPHRGAVSRHGAVSDVLEVQRVVADFVLRDRGDWAALRALFSRDARIHISWHSGTADDFVAACRAAAERGAPPTTHSIGYPRVDVEGDRATADTSVQVVVRAGRETLFDVTSWMRFVDLLERTGERWTIARRTAVYERDRLDAVDPTSPLPVPSADTASFPAAYRNLAFLLSQVGLGVAAGAVVAGSDAEQALLACSRRWLTHH